MAAVAGRTRIVDAARLEPAALLALFNEAYSDYVVPMRLDEKALRDHVESFDIDLEASRVALDGEPAAFALVGIRGSEAWIGGMGTVPARRRHGVGEAVLRAALEAAAARGCDRARLEVIVGNDAAIRLYERLGFERARDLGVWSLAAGGGGAGSDALVDEALAFVAAHREAPEPWQRADATVARLRGRGAQLHGFVLERDGVPAAGVVARVDGGAPSVLQAAAPDADAAVEALGAVAGENGLRFLNVETGSLLAEALQRLGAGELVRQHELRLAL